MLIGSWELSQHDQKIITTVPNILLIYMQVLLQNLSTHEIRTVSQACIVNDITCHRASLEMIQHLFDYRVELQRGTMMPVGSVEFISECMKNMGIPTEKIKYFFDPYPEDLKRFLHRRVRLGTVGNLIGHREIYVMPKFVKPVYIKEFNGFVYDFNKSIDEYDEHDREQVEILQKKDLNDLVYISDVVKFQSEYRYYVDHDKILGSARYDPDGLDDAPSPDINVVSEMIAILNDYYACPVYALDVGVLETGETALVEVNDAWAIGLYGRALEPKTYLEFLVKRWKNIVETYLTTTE